MPIQLSPQEKNNYLKALDLAESKAQQSSNFFEEARAKIRAGEPLSDDYAQHLFQILRPYLEIIHLSFDAIKTTKGSGILTGSLNALSSNPTSSVLQLTSLDLNSPEAARIREHGIRTEADIQLALRYIQTTAPDLIARPLEAFLRSKTIKIVIDDSIPSAEGRTDFLAISYVDRNVDFEKKVRLGRGSSVLTLVHELLVHGILENDQIDLFRKRSYLTSLKEDHFSNIREVAANNLIEEEARAFAMMFLFLKEAEKKDPALASQKLPEILEFLRPLFDQALLQGEDKAIDFLKEIIPKVSLVYSQQLKVIPPLVAVAVKLGRETDPQFAPDNFLDIIAQTTGQKITHQHGEIDIKMAVSAIYQLLKKNAPPGRNTIESFLDAFSATLSSPHKSGNLQLDLLMNVLESYFEGASTLDLSRLRESLKKAPDIGPRGNSVDTSKDRHYFEKPDMAQLVVQGWSRYLEILDELKKGESIGSRRFLQTQLSLAERAQDPLSGKLYGQAWVLAHESAKKEPELLIDLAGSLNRSGYTNQALQALFDYLDQINPILLSAPKEIDSKYDEFLQVVEKLPLESQQTILEKLLEKNPHFALSIDFLKEEFTRYTQTAFRKKIIPTLEEVLEFKNIFEKEYPKIDSQKIQDFFYKVIANHHLAIEEVRLEWEGSRIGSSKRSVEQEFQEALYSIYLNNFSKAIPIAARLLKLVSNWPKTEKYSKTTSQVRVLNEELFQLKKLLDIFSPDDIYFIRGLIFNFLKSGEAFSHGLQLLEQIPSNSIYRVIQDIYSNSKELFDSLDSNQKIDFLKFIFSKNKIELLKTERVKRNKESFAYYNLFLKEAFLDSNQKVQQFCRTALQDLVAEGASPEMILEIINEIAHLLPSDIPLLKQTLRQYQASLARKAVLHINERESDDYKTGQAFFGLIPKIIDLSDTELVEIGFQISEEFEKKMQGVPDREMRGKIWSYRISKNYSQWRELLKRGEFSTLQLRINEFIEAVNKDLEGRAEISGESLVKLARWISDSPKLHNFASQLFHQAILRYSRAWGASEATLTMNQISELRHKQRQLRDFIIAVQTSSLDHSIKDELFYQFVQKVSEAMIHKSVFAIEDLTVLKALKEYLGSDRYPKTDHEIYSKGLLLLTIFQVKKEEFSSEDILTVLTYFDSLLEENPWLGDASHYEELKKHFLEDEAYQRNLRNIYPEIEEIKKDILLSDGSLNIVAAREGGVDLDLFEQKIFEKLKGGSLEGEKLTAAISSLLKGRLRSSVNKERLHIFDLLKSFPSFHKIWDQMQKVGLSSNEGKALLEGIIEGFSGEFIGKHTLVFAELLESKNTPLDAKRKIWLKLKEGKALNSFVDQYLSRHILGEKHALNESDYYSNIGKLMRIENGSLPRSEAILLLLKNPQDSSQFFQAFKKWVHLRDQGFGKTVLDLSNSYDTLLMEILLSSFEANSSRRQGSQVTFNGAEQSLIRNELYLYQNNDVKLDVIVTASNHRDLTLAKNKKLSQQRSKECAALINEVIIESEVLPPFLEAFSKNLKVLFGAIVSQLSAGKKQLLSERLKRTEEKEKTESLSPEKLRGKLLYELFRTLGWAKIGQLLSVSPMLPEEVRKELKEFQDEVPSSTGESIEAALKREHFERFVDLKSVKVIKSGSIGEVVQATLTQDVTLETGKILKVGEQIAIKLVTDERRFYAEREIFTPLKEAIELLKRAGHEVLEGIHLESTYEQIEETMRHEMDLKNERSFMERYGKLPEGLSRPQLITKVGGKQVVPSSSVLAMEWIEGKKLDPEQIQDPKQREEIVKKLKTVLLKPFEEALQDKVEKVDYQGDPHPGNAFHQPSGNMVILDFGQGETITVKELDLIVKLMVTSRLSGQNRVKQMTEALITMDLRPTSEKKVNKKQLQQSIREIFNESSEQSTIQNLNQSNKFFDLIKAAQNTGVRISKPFNALFKSINTLEGGILAFDRSFSLSETLESTLKNYATKRFGKRWILVNFGKEQLKTSIKEMTFKTVEGTANAFVGGVPYGIGEIGSTFIMGLLFPGYHLPKTEELIGNFAIMSAGGGVGSFLTNGFINKVEGKAFLERVLPPKVGEGFTGKGLARRFFPLAAAMILDDIIKGRPIDLKNTAEGMAHIGIASGVVHLMGAGVRNFKWTERLATGLRLLKIGSTAGAPESGGATLLGAAVASVIEFTILKGMSYAEKKYVYHQEAEKYKTAYSRTVVEMNSLVKEIEERGLENVSAEQIVQVRRNLEQAKIGYLSYFEWRVKNLEEEREMARKELEEDRQEYLIDRGGRSTFEINQMYDEKIAKLNREYAEEITTVKGSEQVVEFQSLALKNPDILKMSPTAPQVEIPTIQTRVIKRTVAESQHAFIAQHQTYEDRLIITLKKAQENYYRKELKTVFPNIPDSEINQTVTRLTQSQMNEKQPPEPINWEQINQHLQQINQSQLEASKLEI